MKFLLTLFLLTFACAHAAETFSFHHENVLGTSLELRVTTESQAEAKAAEQSVLAEVDRLSAILSTWSKESEIMRWQTAGKPHALSADLVNVLKACDHWTANSLGAFHVQPAFPDRSLAPWTFDAASGMVTYHAKPGEITIDALAKGYIIDRAVDKAMTTNVQKIVLNIGGDLRVSGDAEELIHIAQPHHDAENAMPLASVHLKNQALATSGNYRRGKHIIDPRTQKPAEGIASASVIAPDTTTADALATIFSVLSPEESMRLTDELRGVSCMIVTRDGETFQSQNWPTQQRLVVTDAPKEMELTIDFEINRPEAERYLRPYVAVWIADGEGNLVRTLHLWILKGNKGLKWLPRLKQWNRADAQLRVRGVTPDIPPISSATRKPGNYSVVWDGLDDAKKPVPAGEYTVYIEAAREHGTYQVIKKPITIGGEAFKETLEGNLEIKAAALDYHPKAVAN